MVQQAIKIARTPFQIAAMALVCFLFLSSAANSRAQGRELRIAAASDLKFAMQELAEEFEKQSAGRLAVTYGSSGNFFAQLQNGAPFDLFFSADIDYPKKLEAAGLTVPGSLYSYAVGRIAIWLPADSKIDLAKQGWNALLDPRVQKIAIANPEHAPYGRAGIAALQKAGIYGQVRSKLVFGENVSQAAQFVQSGNAQAGIVAVSLAVSPAMKDGQRWEIPPSLYPALEQGAVILKGAQNREAAAAFLEFIKTAAARATLAKYGFTPPPAAVMVR
jgi:molybdate transport system substrate-binding protein